MKQQFVILCVDTGKYYRGRFPDNMWDSDIRNAYQFNTELQANDEFINDDEVMLEAKFERDLPDNPIFKIETLITKKYL